MIELFDLILEENYRMKSRSFVPFDENKENEDFNGLCYQVFKIRFFI